MAAGTHRHRKGKLHQTNKPFKGATKRRNVECSESTAARPTVTTVSKVARLQRKEHRKAQSQQVAFDRHRLHAESDLPPPKVVLLLPLHHSVVAKDVKQQIIGLSTSVYCPVLSKTACSSDDNAKLVDAIRPGVPVTVDLPSWAGQNGRAATTRLTLLDCPVNFYQTSSEGAVINSASQGEMQEDNASTCCSIDSNQEGAVSLNRDLLELLLDQAKVADIVCFLLPPTLQVEQPPISFLGYLLLSVLRSQGCPSVIGHMVTATSVLRQKTALFSELDVARQRAAVKLTARFFHSELGEEARFTHDYRKLCQALCAMTPMDLTWRSKRGYLLVDSIQCTGEHVFELRGYARNLGITLVNGCHITGVGDMKIPKLRVLADPFASSSHFSPSMNFSSESESTIQLSNDQEASLIANWDRLAPYDPLNDDQPLPTDDEEDCEEYDVRKELGDERVLTETEDQSRVANSATNGMSDDDGDDEAHHQAANKIPSDVDDECPGEEGGHSVEEDAVVLSRRKRLQFVERSEQDMDIPDEVDTPVDRAARERFARFRGLRSFVDSPWDPYEDLPSEYSRLSTFEAFSKVNRYAVARTEAEAAYSGYYIAVTVDLGVAAGGDCDGAPVVDRMRTLLDQFLLSKNQPAENRPQRPIIISTLLPFERKVTVNHFQLQRVKAFADAVLISKHDVVLQSGFSRFPARPLYSFPAGARLRYRRRIPSTDAASFVASCICPTVFNPTSVLLIVGNATNACVAAAGVAMPPSPERLIIKRIALTGYPMRTHKERAVVRYMFFNAPDVRWFSPVQLETRNGLRGHITEPLGTHGYMKCLFSGPVEGGDIVIMPLYKRVFPKWFPPSWGETSPPTF